MATGTVKWFSDEKGFGFITPDDQGKDLFVHHTGIAGSGFKSLAEGAKVSYDAENAGRDQATSPARGSSGTPGRSAAACFLASFLACFRSRRSRSAFSRVNFAIVVFFLALEPMGTRPFRAERRARQVMRPRIGRPAAAATGDTGRTARVPNAVRGPVRPS